MNKQIKAIHIVNWFPNIDNPFETLFVREHVQSLAPYVAKNEVLHLEVVESEKDFVRLKHYPLEGVEGFAYRLYLTKKLARPAIKEFLTLLLLLWALRKYKVNKLFDILVFHVAYPLGTYTSLIKKVIKVPFVFLEHWTAYHFNFNMPKDTKKLDRIKRIFHHKVPLLTVSKALGEDIKSFSGAVDFPHYVLPNVVDANVFTCHAEHKENMPQYFMVNFWRTIKSPFPAFEGFRKLLKEYPNAVLRVGGYGPLWKEMEQYVQKYSLEHNIILLGKLQKSQIAKEMQGITAFVHSTSYETFSVVTAEALLCGTPVVVSKIPAVAEFVHQDNGLLIEGSTTEDWYLGLKNLFVNRHKYDRVRISQEVTEKFSKEAVGKVFAAILSDVKAR
ncbi:glycosyltransferase family 4 protein [Algivirga pacifica]|uniref:Glycosyltransferase family 4 protein n=1 Tax=Algivirga pacifica TaxID=1162670 RepID=A0ABP9DIH1_9BACT